MSEEIKNEDQPQATEKEVDTRSPEFIQFLVGDLKTTEEKGNTETQKDGNENKEELTGSKPTSKESQDDKKSTEKDDFIFDKSSYEKLGITDFKVLEILEKKDKTIFHEQKLIGKNGQLLGNEKENSRNLEAQLLSVKGRLEALEKEKPLSKEEYNSLFEDDPHEAQSRMKRSERLEEEKRVLSQERDKLSGKQQIDVFVSDFASKASEIVEVMRSDHPNYRNPEYDSLFKAILNDPYLLPPELAINIAKRVELKREFDKLKIENEGLKKVPSKVVERIKNLGEKNTTSIPVGSGNNQGKDIKSVLPGLMSVADLKSFKT